jgi:hypothetical protein
MQTTDGVQYLWLPSLAPLPSAYMLTPSSGVQPDFGSLMTEEPWSWAFIGRQPLTVELR